MDRNHAPTCAFVLAMTALAFAMASTGAVAQPSAEAQGTLTAHATIDGPAGDEFTTCQFYVRGHGVAGASGTATFFHAPNGTFEPASQEVAFEGTANGTGGFDFVAGPFEVPAGSPEASRANTILANVTTETGFEELFLQGLKLTCPTAEVPFFTSPLALVLGTAGLLGAGLVLRRKR